MNEENSGPSLPQKTDTATGLYENGQLTDICVRRKGRDLRMLGAAGVARELALLPQEMTSPPDSTKTNAPDTAGKPSAPGTPCPQTQLPVFLGAGTGAALEKLIAALARKHGPDFFLIVADKEADIQAVSAVRERFGAYSGIRWLDEPSANEAINILTRLQEDMGGLPMLPLINPFYTRIDKEWYGAVRRASEASAKADFWTRARTPRFAPGPPRLLLLTSKYFLMGEIIAACERLNFPHRLLQVPPDNMGYGEFVEQLLTAVIEFKPDFLFTINHLGIDREGLLTELAEKLRLPLASWFVDNPHLVLSLYPRLSSSWTTLFTWDADNIASLRDKGFNEVHYLPLGVDTARFSPSPAASFPGLPKAWNGQVAFVGNSMVHKVLSRKDKGRFPSILTDHYKEAAAAFARSHERSVRDFLVASRPDLLSAFDALPDIESTLSYETLLTWEATRQYRLECVQSMLPFTPLVAGDDGWKLLLAGQSWLYRSEMSYYIDLPRFYPCASINFNCTSKQMKGAVNQRVFDVPACGAFLLTDYRDQVENLFEPGREIICYHSPEEATALATEYLAQPDKRRAVALAARKRILAEHTYEHRLRSLTSRMRAIYG